ncbi:Hypothetical protein GbCGDNIH9_8450 [Granulibacter bethesdensis]|uniref:Uncharacterized protein n=1 Tax=Granulibacter bethesdensis TaxID=364410 RepID=A0AAC9KDE8_9PROT|nr:Hypothetical protein GbCGDNIH9_8450 [Granulibacter bethesdensis]APH61680.1 Hypothetical protein GbCGDNIH8_8450 [Granulibacter bethesdensis]
MEPLSGLVTTLHRKTRFHRVAIVSHVTAIWAFIWAAIPSEQSREKPLWHR